MGQLRGHDDTSQRRPSRGSEGCGAERLDVAPTLSAVAQDLTIAPVTPDQGEAAVAGPPLPEVARERYEVMGTFARGGVGKIVRAREPHLERTVALKELRRGSDPDSRERFIREARLTARLQHPSIVPVYDAGLWPDGDPFFSMKLVSGRSLARVLREAETLADRLALLPHVLAVAEAIAYAHSQRIIHRDLKPGNILIGEFGETVVIDWGLAKDLDQAVPEDSLPAAAARGPSLSASRSSGESEQGLTLTGMIMGTPAYMPPEQAIGIPVDERADVYALGAILYHLLTGQPPYQGEDSVEVLRQVTLGPPPPISRIARGVSEELRAIVDKAMARRPEQRYPSAREFAEDLRRYQTGKIVGAHRYTTYERLIRFARRYRTPLAALVVLAISGAVAFVEIVEEKRVAEEQRAAAQAAQAEAERERRLADAHADDLTLEQARLAVHSDPGRALQLLARLSPQFNEWNAARVIASDARAQGLATVLRGHTATVNAVAFSRDGASLYTSSDDRTIRRSNAFTGALERVYSGHEDEVWGIAVAPDGATLASGSKDKTVRLWDVETGEARVLRGHTQGVFNVVFAGEFVFSFSHDRLVRLWNPSTGELRDTFDVRDAPERQFAFVGLGQSGRALIHEGEGGAMFMTDIYTRAQVRFDPGGVLTGASLSADGRRVAATTDDGRMHLWSDDGASLPIPGYTGEGKASRVSLTPDGAMILYADDRGFIVLRDLESGESREFVVDRRMAGGFRLSPDGEWLAAPLSDGTLHLIGVRSGEHRVLRRFNDAVLGLSFSSDSARIAASSYDHTARVWEVTAPSHEVLRGHANKVTVVRNGPSGRLIASGDTEGALHLHDRVRGKTIVVDAHDARITQLAFSPEGDVVATAAVDGAVRFWDRSGQPLAEVTTRHDGEVLDLVFSPDGRVVASADARGEILLWAPARGQARALERPPGHDALDPDRRAFRALVFTPDGATLAAGGDDLKIRLWRVADGRLERELSGHRGRVTALAFTRDGDELISGSTDHTIRLWDARGWDEAASRSIDVGGNGVTQIVVTRDDAAVITISREQAIRVWERATGAARTVLRGHEGQVGAVSLSPDGSTLASAASDATVRLWDLASGESRVLRGHTGSVRDVHFAPDGDSIVSSAEDGTVRVWSDDLPRGREGLREWLAEVNAREEPRPREASSGREVEPVFEG